MARRRTPQSRSHAAIVAIRLALVVGVVAGWELAVRAGLLNPLFFGRPLTIIQYSWIYLKDGTLPEAAAITLGETIVGFVLGTAVGICIASILWWLPRLGRILEGFIVTANAIPKVTLVPILIVLFGVGVAMKVIMAFLNVVVFATLIAHLGMKNADRDLIDLVRANNGTRWQVFRHVVWPSSFGALITGMKIGISMSFIGAVVGEFLASRAGLGYLAVYGSEIFNMSLVMCAVLTLMALAIVLFSLVQLLEQRLLVWRPRA